MARVAQCDMFSQMKLARSKSDTIKAIIQACFDATFYFEINQTNVSFSDFLHILDGGLQGLSTCAEILNTNV